MKKAKGLLQSKAALGALVALVGAALGWSDEVTVQVGVEAQAVASLALELGGALLSLYGTWRRQGPVAGLWRRGGVG